MENWYKIDEVSKGIWHIDEGGLDSAYIVRGNKRALLIDTGTGIGNLKAVVEKYLDVPYDVVLTHGHVDHAGGLSQFEQAYLNEKDVEMTNNVTVEDRMKYISSMNAVNSTNLKATDMIQALKTDKKPKYLSVKEGDVFSLGGKEVKIYECPGHTQGSICLCDETEKIIFTGDSMNDLELLCAPEKDRRELLKKWYESVKKILTSQKEFLLCCGGHSVFKPEKAWEVLECGRKILTNEIQMKKMKKHIFIGNFAQYKHSFITLDEILDRV